LAVVKELKGQKNLRADWKEYEILNFSRLFAEDSGKWQNLAAVKCAGTREEVFFIRVKAN
jgi:hypothetical protein